MLISTVISRPLKRSKSVRSVPFLIIAICLAATVTAINMTNINPLIPLLRRQLGVDNGRIGLLSTGFFLGLTMIILPTGLLLDRYGARRVLISAFWVLGLLGVLLPFLPENFTWLLLWRTVIGLMVGATLVAGTYAVAHLGEKYTLLAQGLFGGFIQVGFGVGMIVTPLLVAPLGWRDTFLIWGLPAFIIALYWFLAHEEKQVPDPYQCHASTINTKLRLGSVRAAILLGLINMGTFGVANTLVAWITVYLINHFGLPLALAASLGSTSLFAGMFIRPITGILLARDIIGASTLIRIGTILTAVSTVVLALPFYSLALAMVGILLLALGANLPFAGVFSTAAHVGAKSGIGVGTTQGIALMLAMPVSIIGIPLVGFIYEHSGSFTPAFGAIAALFCSGGVLASTLLGSNLRKIMAHENTLSTSLSIDEPSPSSKMLAHSEIKPDKLDLVAFIQALPASHTTVLPDHQSCPFVLLLYLLTTGDEGANVLHEDSFTLRSLLNYGFSPVSLPLLSTSYQHPRQIIKDEALFHQIFDQFIWPAFSFMLYHRIRGFCMTGGENLYLALKNEPGEHENLPLLWREMIERYIDLLARLIGMPVIEIGTGIRSVKIGYKGWKAEQQAGVSYDSRLIAHNVPYDGDRKEAALLSTFYTKCASYVPPDLDALQPLSGEIFAWLRQHDRILFHQMRTDQVDFTSIDKGHGESGTVPRRWTKDKLLAHKRKRMVTKGQPRSVHVRKPTMRLFSYKDTGIPH